MVLEEIVPCKHEIGENCTIRLRLTIPPNAIIPTNVINIEISSINDTLILSKPRFVFGSNYNIGKLIPFVNLYSEYDDSRVTTKSIFFFLLNNVN